MITLLLAKAKALILVHLEPLDPVIRVEQTDRQTDKFYTSFALSWALRTGTVTRYGHGTCTALIKVAKSLAP